MTVRVSLIKDKKIVAEKEITEEKLLLGRQGDIDIIRDEGGLSREHGEVLFFNYFILYKDLGSTNGSWIDGKKMVPNKWGISSYPCFLQLADVILGISQDDNIPSNENMGAIAIFKDGEFFKTYLLKRSGKSLMIGGDDADFIITAKDRSSYESDLIIEAKADNLFCYSKSNEFEIKMNGNVLHGKGLINDNDIISMDNFEIYVTLFKPSFMIYDNTSTEDEKQAMRLRMLENAVPTLKAWEDEDFDVADVFENRKEEKVLDFQKNNPLLNEEELLNRYKNSSIDFVLFEKIIFWSIGGLAILTIIFLILSIFIR